MEDEKANIKPKPQQQQQHQTPNLDTSRADKSVWLMKCPVLVAKAWQSQQQQQISSDPPPHPVVAKVVLSIDPLNPDDLSSRRFTMEMARTETGSMPKVYSLNMCEDIIPMTVFSESTQGRVAVEGKVEHKFDMKPHSETLEEYGKLCRERTNKANFKNRQIQMIDNDRGLLMRPMPGMMGLTALGSKDKKRMIPVKPTDTKRTRRDRGELEDIMFKLFERQPNWALKLLVQETDQPAQFLKEILLELCFYNKRGPNQGTYELKPEYKKSAEETGAA